MNRKQKVNNLIRDFKALGIKIFIRQLATLTDTELNLFYNKRYNIV